MVLPSSIIQAAVLVFAAVCGESTAFMLASNATGTAIAVARGANPLAAASLHATVDSNLETLDSASPHILLDKSSQQTIPALADTDANHSIFSSLCARNAEADAQSLNPSDSNNRHSGHTTRESPHAAVASTKMTLDFDGIIIRSLTAKFHGTFLAPAASLNNWTIASLLGFAVVNLSFVIFM